MIFSPRIKLCPSTCISEIVKMLNEKRAAFVRYALLIILNLCVERQSSESPESWQQRRHLTVDKGDALNGPAGGKEHMSILMRIRARDVARRG